MKVLENEIDFVALTFVANTSPNDSLLDGNCPYTTYTGSGEISDARTRRRVRNRLQDMREDTFIQLDERCDDGYDSLSK